MNFCPDRVAQDMRPTDPRRQVITRKDCNWLVGRSGTPNGTRTRVSAVKGRRPRPLDDGRAVQHRSADTRRYKAPTQTAQGHQATKIPAPVNNPAYKRPRPLAGCDYLLNTREVPSTSPDCASTKTSTVAPPCPPTSVRTPSDRLTLRMSRGSGRTIVSAKITPSSSLGSLIL